MESINGDTGNNWNNEIHLSKTLVEDENEPCYY